MLINMRIYFLIFKVELFSGIIMKVYLCNFKVKRSFIIEDENELNMILY